MASRGGREPLAETRRPLPSDSGIDVLVVDDSGLMRASIVRACERAGLRAASLATPIGVTRAIVRMEPRVVLIDLDMPAMRGDRLIGTLRQREHLRHVKLVLMSGYEANDLAAIARAAGADAMVAKAEGSSAIVRVVQAVLEQRSK